MPAVQPVYLPRLEPRIDRLGARACTACGAKGWLADDSDGAPGRGRICGTCDRAALKTYARVGTVRLDYCNACDSVTMIDDSSTH